ncbi:MAG: hypothetical protein MI749_09510 [Desulfovibrionales bacterium]|nr:hypothetical protein [Desulfovibrionales bacterium]
MQRVIKVLFIVLVVSVTVACAARFNPETRMYTVYGVSKFMLPEGYTEVGRTTVNVLPKTNISGAFPYQSFNTTIFHDGESYIFSQVLILSGGRYYIRPLGGAKVFKWGVSWRQGMYQLSPANTSDEYRRYFKFIRDKGLPVASGYAVDVYDRLIGRRAVTRVMILRPDNGVSGYASMPPANAFYTLWRDDFRSR